MREFQDKRTWRRIGHSPLVLIALAVLIGLALSPVWRLYQKNRLVSAEQRLLLEEVERLKDRQTKLAAEVEKLSTDRGVEEAIRENFNVARPGESVLYLLSPSSPPAEVVATPGDWWTRFIGWLGL